MCVCVCGAYDTSLCMCQCKNVQSCSSNDLWPAGTSKAGLDMVTKVMALELGPHQVWILNAHLTSLSHTWM